MPEQFQEKRSAVGLGAFAVAFRPELRETENWSGSAILSGC
jgi:hypothetical protein